MLASRPAFSSFSANDIEVERVFFRDTLGLQVTEANGMLNLERQLGE